MVRQCARVVILVLLAAGLAGCGKFLPSGPRAVFETTRQDAGTVGAGDRAEVRFPVRNAGGAPLRILNVQGTCGCLTQRYPDRLPPGGSGQITVRFEAQLLWRGKQEKSLTVSTDDPRQSQVKLVVAADVIPFVRMEPPSPVQVQYKPGQVFHREVRLIPRPGSPLRLSNPTCESPLVKAILKPPSPSDPERAYRLRLTIGPCPSPGDFTVSVICSTSDTRMPVLPVAVVGLAQSGPVVIPPRILVPMVRPGGRGKELGRLQVLCRTGPIRILGVDTGNSGITAEVRAEIAGRSYIVILRYAGGWKPGPVNGTIRIRIDDPKCPVARIPFATVVQ